jgi:dCTP deaminase
MKLGGEALRYMFGYSHSGNDSLEKSWTAYLDGRRMADEEFMRRLGPNSVDVTLGPTLLLPIKDDGAALDLRAPELEWTQVDCTSGHRLEPGDFCLSYTLERFETIAPMLAGTYRYFAQFYEGRSTMGRIGLGSHVTAGFGDYGFCGAFTLELYNHFPYAIVLYPALRIGQVSFEEVFKPCTYSGSYSIKEHFSAPVGPCLSQHRLFYKEEE